MKLILKMMAFVIVFSKCKSPDRSKLYPFHESERFGYINQKGEVVIEPKFRAASEFSEGLAAARLDGNYGFIDSTGEFVIEPKLDFAMSFEKGMAEVYIEGKPYYIRPNGEIVFQHNFKFITPFSEGDHTIAITNSNKSCLINRRGELLTDTIFSKIGCDSDGYIVVEGLGHDPSPRDENVERKFEVGVIDTLGHWMIPFGKF